MKKLYKLIHPAGIIVATTFIVLLTIKPGVGADGAAYGLVLCGRVIIPALFPSAFFLIFIQKSGALRRLSFLNPFTARVFRQTPEQFGIMLFSLIGGYPLGAKLIDELAADGKISEKNARLMLMYCVNAGPAFIVIAVGSEILHSRPIGIVLLAAHIASSVILALVFGRFIIPGHECPKVAKSVRTADNFVISAGEAASSTLSICFYVILFSAINAYLSFFAKKIEWLGFLRFFLEITNGVSGTKNVLLISFLLGFAGISVWFQVLSVSRHIRINLTLFAAARIFHGLLSVCLTAVFLRFFRIALPPFSNTSTFPKQQ